MSEGYDPQDCEYAPLFEKYVLINLPEAQYVDKQKEGGKVNEQK